MIFVLVVVVLLAGIVEGFVRIRHWYKYGDFTRVEKSFIIDTTTGLRIPQTQGPIKINKFGFRNPDLPVPKPPSRIRIAFLGGSTTFCAEATSNETTWPHLVWKILQEKFSQKSFDYINAGVPGYQVETSLKNLQKRVKSLEPDVIIIYHATNDISYDSRLLAKQQKLLEGEVVKTSWLSEWSMTWFLAEKNIQVWLRQKASQNDSTRLKFQPDQLSQKFRNDLIDLVTASKKVAPIVVVATFSHKFRRAQTTEEQLQASNTALYYMPYMSLEGLLDAFDEYNQVIREIAAQMDVILVTEEDAIPPDNKHFNDSVHFTDAGNRIMAQRIVNRLFEENKFINFIKTH